MPRESAELKEMGWFTPFQRATAEGERPETANSMAVAAVPVGRLDGPIEDNAGGAAAARLGETRNEAAPDSPPPGEGLASVRLSTPAVDSSPSVREIDSVLSAFNEAARGVPLTDAAVDIRKPEPVTIMV